MTKAEFKRVAKGKIGMIKYPNGNFFQGEVIIKSKEMVIDGLHCLYRDIVRIDRVADTIQFETKNGIGSVSLD